MAFDGNKKRKYFSSSLVDCPVADFKSQKRHRANQISLKTNVNVSLVEGGIKLSSDFFDQDFIHSFCDCEHFVPIKHFDPTESWIFSDAHSEEHAIFQYLVDNRDTTLEEFNTCFPSFDDNKITYLNCSCSTLLAVIYDRPDLLQHLYKRLLYFPRTPEIRNAFCFACLFFRTECLNFFVSHFKFSKWFDLPNDLQDFFNVKHLNLLCTLSDPRSFADNMMDVLYGAFKIFVHRFRKNEPIDEDKLQHIIDISVAIMPNQFPCPSLAPMLEVVVFCLKHNFSWLKPHHIDFWRCLPGVSKLSHPRLLKNDMLVSNMSQSYQKFIQHPQFDSNLLGLIDSYIIGSPKEIIPIQSLSNYEIQTFFEKECQPHYTYENEHDNEPCMDLTFLYPSKVMMFWHMAIDDDTTKFFNWEKALTLHMNPR